MSAGQPSRQHRFPEVAHLVLCRTCAAVPGGEPALTSTQITKLASKLPAGFRIRTTACMNSCAEPVAMALQAHGKATYFFTGIEPDSDASDIIRTCEVYTDADDGWIEDARQCGRLRFCLRGRVPPINSPE